MKKTRRLFLALLAFCLILGSMPFALAAETKLKVSYPMVIPQSGESFTVSVTISENSGFNAIQIKLLYDDTVVRCDSASGGKLIKGTFQSSNTRGTRDGVGAMLAAASLDTVAGDGEVGVFKFTVINAGNPKFSLSDIVLTDENRQGIPHSITMAAMDETGTQKELPQEISQEIPEDISQETERPTSFSDVPESHWAAQSINEAVGLGLIEGYEDETFRPDEAVTRAQFVTILWRMAGAPKGNVRMPFSDVYAADYYYNAVAWANENGYVEGISDTAFCPNGNITREQAMTILHRYAGNAIGMESMLTGIYDNQFSDSANISDYAKNAVYWAVYNGIVTGMTETTLAPKQTSTRAQITVIFLRYINKNK